MKNKPTITIIDHTTVYITPSGDISARPFRVSADFDYKTYTVTEWTYNVVHPHASEYTSTPLRYISQEELTAAEKTIVKGIAQVKRNISNGKKHPAYQQMKKIFESTVKHYQDDFNFFDVARLGTNDGIEFIWSVRECGTWYFCKSENEKAWANAITTSAEAQDFYHWSGNVLKKITRQDARRILAL